MSATILFQALENTYKTLSAGSVEARDSAAAHVLGLEAREGRGSYVEGVNDRETLEAFMVACVNHGSRIVSHEEMEERYPASTFGPCTYVELLIPDTYTALLGVTSMEAVLSKAEPGETLDVTVRRSLHDTSMVDEGGRLVTNADGNHVEVPAFEVVLNGTREDMPSTNHAFVIVGPSSGEDSTPLVWTWHPGPPTAAPSRELVEMLRRIVVKIAQ